MCTSVIYSILKVSWGDWDIIESVQPDAVQVCEVRNSLFLLPSTRIRCVYDLTVDFRAIEIDLQEAISRFLNVPGKSGRQSVHF